MYHLYLDLKKKLNWGGTNKIRGGIAPFWPLVARGLLCVRCYSESGPANPEPVFKRCVDKLTVQDWLGSLNTEDWEKQPRTVQPEGT